MAEQIQINFLTIVSFPLASQTLPSASPLDFSRERKIRSYYVEINSV
jgi:hypothetical protein